MTTVTVGDAATHNEKELKRDYPVTEGLTAGTNKQEGRILHLEAEEGSTVSYKKTIGVR